MEEPSSEMLRTVLCPKVDGSASRELLPVQGRISIGRQYMLERNRQNSSLARQTNLSLANRLLMRLFCEHSQAMSCRVLLVLHRLPLLMGCLLLSKKHQQSLQICSGLQAVS